MCFFSDVHPHGYRAAFIHTIPYVGAIFVLAAVIAIVLPKTALDESEALGIENAPPATLALPAVAAPTEGR